MKPMPSEPLSNKLNIKSKSESLKKYFNFDFKYISKLNFIFTFLSNLSKKTFSQKIILWFVDNHNSALHKGCPKTHVKGIGLMWK